MYNADVLLDIFERCHQSLSKLLDHCRSFSEEELDRSLEGFGHPTIREQFHHEIGAQKYWIGVLEGRMDVDDTADEYRTIDALESYRKEVFGITEQYLRSASSDELNTARTMVTWGDQEVELVPARVVLRTLTHFFQHQGQISAMCRLLGQPIPPGLDFPIR